MIHVQKYIENYKSIVTETKTNMWTLENQKLHFFSMIQHKISGHFVLLIVLRQIDFFVVVYLTPYKKQLVF